MPAPYYARRLDSGTTDSSIATASRGTLGHGQQSLDLIEARAHVLAQLGYSLEGCTALVVGCDGQIGTEI